MNQQLSIRLNSRLIVILLGVLLILAIIVSNRLLYYLFYTVALLAIFAYYWTGRRPRRLAETRDAQRLGSGGRPAARAFRCVEQHRAGPCSGWRPKISPISRTTRQAALKRSPAAAASRGGTHKRSASGAASTRWARSQCAPAIPLASSPPPGPTPTTQSFLVYPPIVELPASTCHAACCPEPRAAASAPTTSPPTSPVSASTCPATA